MVHTSPRALSLILSGLGLIALVQETVGNVFLNNPRGSNNKMTEASNTAENPKRLFRSENNANGGHNVGDNCIPNCRSGANGAYNPDTPVRQIDANTGLGSQLGQMYYYTGSELYIEWDTLHGCGSPSSNVDCQIILQYLCDSWSYDANQVRDGRDPAPVAGQPMARRRSAGAGDVNPTTPPTSGAAELNAVTAATAAEPERGVHESFSSFEQCRARTPNLNLYNGAPNLDATTGSMATRQNPTGEKYGMECQEERDYYPYWHPSEWKDIAVFSSRAEKDCSLYETESQNVKEKNYCATDPAQPPNPYNNRKDCEGNGGTWAKGQSWKTDPPVCRALVPMEENTMGVNSAGKYQSYTWKIPKWTLPQRTMTLTEDYCVLRIRYNITAPYTPEAGTDYDYFNLVNAEFNPDGPYGGNDPPFAGILGLPLNLQLESKYFSRTFEDRSHVFKVRNRPESLSDAVRIVNYNVRGRRGTPGQVYPSPAYGFVPPDLQVNQGDFLHFQWTGSDNNPVENTGGGKTGTDRTNLVQMDSATSFSPLPITKHTLFFDGAAASTVTTEPYTQTCHGYFFAPCTRGAAQGQKVVAKLAYLGQELLPSVADATQPACQALAPGAVNDQLDANCAVLNHASAYFDGDLVEMVMTGEFHVASTRNNDFSYVSHKAAIFVSSRVIYWWVWVVTVLGVIFGTILCWQCGRACYAYANPTSELFSRRRRPLLLKAPFPPLRWAVQKKDEERRQFKKELQEAWKRHVASKAGDYNPTQLKKAKTLAGGSKDGGIPGVAGAVKLPVAPVGNSPARAKGKGKGLAGAGVPEKRVDPSDGVTYTIQELRAHYAKVYTAAEIDEYWHTMTPASNAAQERRIDPEDGVSYTLAELRTHYAKVYSAQEIDEYWNTMTPVPASYATAGENADLALPPAWLELQQRKKNSRCSCCFTRCQCCPSFGDWFREENLFVFIFLGTNLLCVLIGFLNNYKGGYSRWFSLAKIGGYLLDFNLACILIPTLRSMHSVVRPVRALDTLFNDEPIHFHLNCAMGVAIGSICHITGHTVHIIQIVSAPRFEQPATPIQKLSGMSVAELLFNPANRFAGFTGLLLAYGFSPMFATAMEKVRRRTFNFKKFPTTIPEIKGWMLLTFAVGLLFPVWLPPWMYRVFIKQRCKGRWAPGENGKLGGFTVFWEIHKLWRPMFVILLVHGPNCWIWFMFPLAMLLCDRLVKWERRRITSHLRSATLLKGKTMRLEFTPPNGFTYQAGTYIILNCDMVGPEEWHPFTLTSAPEENFISVHIRCPDELDWCSALRRKLVEQPALAISNGEAKDKIGKVAVKVSYCPYSPNSIFEEEEDGDDCKMSRPWKIEVFDKDQTKEYKVNLDDKAHEDQRVIAGLEEYSNNDKDIEKQMTRKLRAQESQLTLEDMIRPQRPPDVLCMSIDGPHGANAELVWKHERVILVGAGIGVTPFAAILRSITLRVPTQKELAAGPLLGPAPGGARGSILRRGNSTLGKKPVIGRSVTRSGQGMEAPSGDKKDDKNDKKKDGEATWKPCENAHFYWLCRSQDEFEWFSPLLNNAVAQASKDRVEVNLFKTGETELTNVKSIGGGVFREFFGRPNWNRIFPKLAEKYPGESVGVFYCGVRAGRADLGAACIKATATNEQGTRFTLHAENF